MEPQRRRFPRMGQRFQQVTHRLGWTPAGRRVMRDRLVVVLLFITVLMGPNGVLTNLPISHATPRGVLGSPGQPNLFDPTQGANSVLWKPPAGRSDPNWQPPPPQTLGHTLPPSMQPGTLALHPGVDTRFLGSDGHLEVDVPGSAVSAADLTQAGGALTLKITQIAPGAGSSAGGSGLISFGTYLVQLLDNQGRRVPHGIPIPITLKWHYGAAESALNLAHAFVVFNAPLPTGVHLAPAENASVPGLGTMSTQSTRLDTTAQTLTVVTPLTGPSTSISWNTDSPVATFGKPDPFNVGLSAGSLSAIIPIDVPTGPGGLTPPVYLSYSSAGVSEQHNPQGAADWVGEGWNLSLGSISWAEHNTAAGVGGTNWQDTWELNDPFGTSAQLIPPNINVSTYYDDTTHGITASPITWHTAPETHALIVSYTGSVSIPGMSSNPPCFRAFLPNGIMEEFGCTPDSLQYYYSLSGTNAGKAYIANWFLDLTTDREGNQIHLTYTADTATDSGGHTYPRDVALSTIEWDSPGCLNAQQACTGSNWAPQMRVSFAATHGPARLTALLPGVCNTGANLRCDDPLDLSGSGGLVAPQVQSTFTLNDILVQVRPGGTGNWNTLKDYQLGYEEGGPSTVTDPMTNKQESVAGILDLTQLSVVGDDQATLEPIRLFSYTTLTEHYEDDAYTAPAGNCGPSWNSGCLLWSQSYGGDSRYLASASNGMGLLQTFTWAEARNNTHGVNGGGTNTTDPLYCNSHQTGYPCNQADDQNWSHAVLTQETDQLIRLSQNGQGGQQTSTTITSTTSYTYTLSTFSANPCSDCTQGMYWGNQSDGDFLDYYNGVFQGFAQTTVAHPDGSHEVHHYFATEGWGLYDTSQATCYSSNPCHNAPWWDYTNALHGHEYQADYYDTDGTDLKEVQTQYNWICPPSGVNPSQSGRWNNNAVAEVDQENPIAVCDLQTNTVRTYTLDGNTTANSVLQTTTYTYDSYGRVTNQTVTSNDGGMPGSPTTIVTTTSYIWNSAVTATSSSATGTYLLDFPAFSDTEDTSGNRYSCTYTDYVVNGQGQPIWESGAQSNFAVDLVLATTSYTNCGTKANNFADASGPITTTDTYDQWGNQWATTDPDANAGVAGHTITCSINNGPGLPHNVSSSTCTAVDSMFRVLPISSTNALNQTASTGYTQTAAGGFGLWPTSSTDLNGQTTTVTYDGLGRMTSQTLPGETSGQTTTSRTYTYFCGANMPQSPCLEVDTTQRLDSATTITSRAFYDGLGRLVETRSPGPNGQDVVRYRYYDTSGRDVFESIQYFVTAYTGAPGAAAYSIPDSTQPGITTSYPSLLSTTVTDTLSHVSTSNSSVVCHPSGLTDTACYVQVATVDPLGHQQTTLTDALGRETYDRRYSGNSQSTYQVYATTQYTYDYTGNLVQILQPDGSTKTTFQYDMAGRMTGLTDPDLGTESAVFDADGNPTQVTDARGSVGTIYAGYDGLNRQLWRNTTNSSNGAYVTYSYDSTANGNMGVGRLTGESFIGGPNQSLSGSYSDVYDARGQEIQTTLTVGGMPYQADASYDDAGDLLSLTYPNGDVLTTSYTAQGWLAGLSLEQGSTQTTLLNNLTYTGPSGAAGLASSASLNGGTYTETNSYDLLLRLTDAKLTRSSDQTTLFEEAIIYDSASRPTAITTTLPQGTDQQQFCYDEQDRLTWAGSVGTPPCTGTPITPGSLTSAQYTQSFSYDTLDRLTSGPQGSYTYGNSQHLHAVTSIGSGYTASYDAAGNMTCRAPTSATTCTGSQPTGAQLSYDNEGRLIAWQNMPSSPTSTAAYLYDGEGNRVEQQTTQGGTTTTTIYVGGLEEITATGTTTTTKTYYGGLALAVNGVLSYLVADGVGSLTEAVDTNGNVEASQLYAPYGRLRYSSGTMPTSYGFTGQRQDALTGLDYFNARYYDPAAGAFTSADMLLQEGGYNPAGLNRYAYVLDNPETYIDPTGYDGYPWWYYILMGWATLIGAFNNKFGDIHATPDPPPPPIVIRIPPKGPGAGSGRGSDDKRNNRGGKRRPPKGPSGLPNPNKNPITVPGIKGHKIVPTFPRKKQDSQKQDSSKKQADLRRFGEPNANGWDGWAKPVDLRRFGEPNYSSWDGWQSQNQDQNQDQDQNQNQNQNQGGCDLQCQLEWFLVGIAAVGSAILSGSGGGGGLPPIPIPTEGGVPCADPAVRLACD